MYKRQPVALVGTFFLMKLIGFSINLITLSALVLAIAIVVDDAIVVVEAVHAKLDVGYKSARRASIAVSYTHLDVYKRQRWNKEDYDSLLNKFNMMYDLCLLYTSRCV